MLAIVILLTFAILSVCLEKSVSDTIAYNGNAITSDIEFNITELVKKASILNGNDISKNIAFLKTNLGNIYNGHWNIIITSN